MDIRILPSNIANMIAAGEVVQRPSSVVKELVENAVDAGATKIDVVILDAGRTLIQVIDNGCGMSSDQAVLCFQRHATSKIYSADDLQDIETFGFRGEALASIAAVAEVVLKTRTADSEVGVQVSITDATASDPGKQDIREVSTPVGSNFAVSNLFYNTPARRKFLKSDASEMKAIIAEFQRIALCRKDIAFSLSSNGREIFRLRAVGELNFRIRDIFGSALCEELVALEASTTVASVSGFVVRPEYAHKTVSNQFFFVNGRYFRSPYLHKAVMKAYQNLVPDGVAPSYFIYLQVDPHTVDINVHPTKTEIKFEDDNVLFTIVMASVREALGRGSFGERIDFEHNELPQVRNIGHSFQEYKPDAAPVFNEDDSFNPFSTDGFPNQQEWEPAGKENIFPYTAKPAIDARDMQVLMDTLPKEETARPAVLIQGAFLVTTVPSGVLVVDSRRAMQRILYERFLDALSKEVPMCQSILFPVEVEVGAGNIAILEANSTILQRLGFSITQFSPTTVSVQGIPQGLVDDRMAVSALVFELVTALEDEQSSMAASMYSSLACKLAVSAARSASKPSDSGLARTLLDSLYACETPEFTPDGHRIARILTMDELDKMFK